MAKHELSKAEWLDKCEAYCARAEHCAADVRRKLYEWGAPADFADSIEENSYFSNLRKLIQERRSDSEDKRLRFLLQRGFTYEEIKKISHC